MGNTIKKHICKALLLFSLLLIFLVNTTNAQVKYGVTPQAGVSYFGGDNESNNSFGLAAGVEGYVQYDLSKKWGVKGGIGYDFTQNKIDYNGPLAPKVSETINNNFITIPIELVMSPNGKWNISIGAEYRMLLNNKDTVNGEDLKYALNLGVSQKLGKGALGVKFSYGLNDINVTSKNNSSLKYKGTPITIKLLYRIPLKKKSDE
ncbi:PorT family protein [Halosquirtibacter xylanolyticus]|uniref:outer membrane beta-barrel protein n=1 Tax=Halosquirtibacter xylanolyticus TaxID=3374599 RepID=UPI003749E966|nr:PorT family protein [Prolixibacteraceae bacterium]